MGNIDFTTDPAVLTSDLSLVYPSHGGSREFHAIDGVDLSVGNGAVLGILGESGSGKSTLTRFLAARGRDAKQRAEHIRCVNGDAKIFGVSLPKIRRGARKQLTAFIGYLQQDAGAKLTPDKNVGDIIFEPIEERLKHFDRSELGELVAQMFDIMALPLTFLQKYPFELSKGQRQRIAVVQSLMLEPRVYIADEPTLGVDANNRPKIVELLQWYRERSGATTVLVSHDIGVLEALVQDVLVLQEGNAVGYGNINEIFRHAHHSYVQRLAEALRANAYDEIAAE